MIAACDARDGAPDGVLASPATCGFDPRTIAWRDAAAAGCLTAPQAEALARVHAGPRARDGKALARGFPPGGETGPGGGAAWITGEAPGQSLQTVFASQRGANMVFGRADWDFRTFDFDRDVNDRDEARRRRQPRRRGLADAPSLPAPAGHSLRGTGSPDDPTAYRCEGR